MSDQIIVHSSGMLVWRGKEYKVALGKSGVVADKREGDSATPTGCFPLRRVYYRADRVAKPETTLPIQALEPDDGWCDASNDSKYNQYVKMPYPTSAEKLWRKDNVYDVIVTLGHNDDPPVPGKGSAIFMHVARTNYSPTAGCIALTLPDLLEIIKTVTTDTAICIQS